jgi:UDP-N-acetylglucosamine 2-epimerase (non-hydrolysing)
VADLVSDAHFAPTTRAKEALLREGANPARVFVTGNTIVDALLDVSSRPFDSCASVLQSFPADSRLVVITGHRRESFGTRFRELCLAIRELATRFSDVQFIYPVHLNPNVRKPVGEILVGMANIHLLEPLDYLTMVHLMKRASLILTDSGGVQEEAPSLGVPVLVMRDTTERPEGVEAGVVRLVGTSRQRIVSESESVLNGKNFARKLGVAGSPYGDGHAARRIAEVIVNGRMS